MPTHLEIVECLDYASPVAVTAGVASVELAAANNDRKYLRITNLSNAAVYLAFGTTALLNKGIYTAASGGMFEMTVDNLTNEAVNGISSAATKTVIVQEAN